MQIKVEEQVEKESRREIARSWEGKEEMGSYYLKDTRVSVWDGERILKIDSGNKLTTL